MSRNPVLHSRGPMSDICVRMKQMHILAMHLSIRH